VRGQVGYHWAKVRRWERCRVGPWQGKGGWANGVAMAVGVAVVWCGWATVGFRIECSAGQKPRDVVTL
jgi:hypothetical protein